MKRVAGCCLWIYQKIDINPALSRVDTIPVASTTLHYTRSRKRGLVHVIAERAGASWSCWIQARHGEPSGGNAPWSVLSQLARLQTQPSPSPAPVAFESGPLELLDLHLSTVTPSTSSRLSFFPTALLLPPFAPTRTETPPTSSADMAGFGRSNSLSINTGGGGGLLYVFA